MTGCQAQTRAGSFYDPPEFCEEDAEEGSDFCPAHDPDREDDRAEQYWEDLRERMIWEREDREP